MYNRQIYLKCAISIVKMNYINKMLSTYHKIDSITIISNKTILNINQWKIRITQYSTISLKLKIINKGLHHNVNKHTGLQAKYNDTNM